VLLEVQGVDLEDEVLAVSEAVGAAQEE